VDAHAALLVLVLDAERRRFQYWRDGHSFVATLLDEGPLVLHVVVAPSVRFFLDAERVPRGQPAIGPPEREPVARFEELFPVVLRDFSEGKVGARIYLLRYLKLTFPYDIGRAVNGTAYCDACVHQKSRSSFILIIINIFRRIKVYF
jgi:hypothetical protein